MYKSWSEIEGHVIGIELVKELELLVGQVVLLDITRVGRKRAQMNQGMKFLILVYSRCFNLGFTLKSPEGWGGMLMFTFTD